MPPIWVLFSNFLKWLWADHSSLRMVSLKFIPVLIICAFRAFLELSIWWFI